MRVVRSALYGETNQCYTIQRSTDLKTWTDWTNVGGANLLLPVLDRTNWSLSCQFYQAVADW